MLPGLVWATVPLDRRRAAIYWLAVMVRRRDAAAPAPGGRGSER